MSTDFLFFSLVTIVYTCLGLDILVDCCVADGFPHFIQPVYAGPVHDAVPRLGVHVHGLDQLFGVFGRGHDREGIGVLLERQRTAVENIKHRRVGRQGDPGRLWQ